MDPATRKWSEMSADDPASEPGETNSSPAAAPGSDTELGATGQRFPESAAEPHSTADDLWAPPWLRLRADEASAQAASQPGHPEALSSPGYGGPAEPHIPAYGTPAEPPSPPYGSPAEPHTPPYGGPAEPHIPAYGAPAEPPSPPYGSPAEPHTSPYGGPAEPHIPAYGAPAEPPSPPYGSPAEPHTPPYRGPAEPHIPAYGAPAEPPSPPYGSPAEPLDAAEAGSADSAESPPSSSGGYMEAPAAPSGVTATGASPLSYGPTGDVETGSTPDSSAAESPFGTPGPASGFATAEQESSQQGLSGTAAQPVVDFAPEIMGPPDYIFGPPAGAEAPGPYVPSAEAPGTGTPLTGTPGSATPWGGPQPQPNAPGVGPGPGQPEIPGYPMGPPGLPAGQPGLPAGQPGLPAGQPGLPAGQPGLPAGQPGMLGQPGIAGQPPQGPSFPMGAQETATDPYRQPHGYMPNGIGAAPTVAYRSPGAPLARSAAAAPGTPPGAPPSAPLSAWPPMPGMPGPDTVTPEQPTVVIKQQSPRSGLRSRRGQLLALGALITALAVAAAAGGLWHRHSAAQQPVNPAVPSPARPATTKLKLASKIDNVKTDPKPITEAEIFPDPTLSVEGRQFARVAAVVNRHCAYAARGSFAKALMADKCQRVIRATFVDSSKRFVITAGIAALPTKALAKRANRAKRLRRNVWFAGLDGPRGSGAQFISATGGYAYGVVDGRYIIFGYATYANGHTPTGTGPQDHLLASLSRAFALLAQRPITARAQS